MINLSVKLPPDLAEWYQSPEVQARLAAIHEQYIQEIKQCEVNWKRGLDQAYLRQRRMAEKMRRGNAE